MCIRDRTKNLFLLHTVVGVSADDGGLNEISGLQCSSVRDASAAEDLAAFLFRNFDVGQDALVMQLGGQGPHLRFGVQRLSLIHISAAVA